MVSNDKKEHSARNRVLIVIGIIVAIILTLTIVVACVWSQEIKSISNIKKIIPADGNGKKPVYYMEYEGGYHLDEILNEGGVDSSEDLVNTVVNKISKGLVNLNMQKGDIQTGCTTFSAQLNNGNNIFARNYDFYNDASCIIKTDPGNGFHKSIACTDLSKLLIKVDEDINIANKIFMLALPYIPMDGMNDAGLSCAVLVSTQCENATAEKRVSVGTDMFTNKLDSTPTLFMRQILDTASSVDDAVKIAENIDMHEFSTATFHYIVSDSTGKSAVIEWLGENNVNDKDGSNRKLCVTYNTDTPHFQVCTNTINKPNYYINTNMPYAKDRYNFVFDALSKTNGILNSEDDAFAILNETCREKNQGRWSGSQDELTMYCCVYNLTNKTLSFVDNEKIGEEGHRLFFSLDK